MDAGEIPAADDVARLGQAPAAPRRGKYELMVAFAAYIGLRWGEPAALTADRVRPVRAGGRGGPQGDRGPRPPVRRGPQEPQAAADGLSLPDPAGVAAGRVGGRADRRGQRGAGRRGQPAGADVPGPGRGYWWSPNFRRRVLEATGPPGGAPPKASAEQWEMS